jgi:ribosomal protein S18 acetylase RimI-like enzyme
MNELEDAAERIESAAAERWYDAAARAGVSAKTARDGQVLAIALPGTDDIMMNRAFGLGLGLPATEEGVGTLLGWFSEQRVARFLVHAHPRAEPAELRAWLAAKGLRRHRAWMKFARGPERVTRPASELRVERARPEHAGVFADIVESAFHMPASSRPLLELIIGLEGFVTFMSFAGETPAGIGTLFVADGIGWLGFGATKPEFRGRGGQAAVLAARLEAAYDSGCRLVVTETGEAVPGDAQHSYKNILKAGFRELYLRENFVGQAARSDERGER